ncbi:hypothetical protein MMC19_000117 [Ptychographa xylographoides]|nr:hypothetical protein [Ptychographa xylographoides]
MQVFTFAVLVLATAVPTLAFTNGSLVPAYFCNPVPDGMPKSLGELIPFTVKDQAGPLAFNASAGSNLQVVPMTNTQPGNTGYMLAAFHNTLNSILPIQQVITVATMNGGPLIAGQANQLNISSGVPGVAIDGAMLYVHNAAGIRQGCFSDASGTFKAFAGCGLNAQGGPAGVIHQHLISCNASYTGLSYNVPICGPANGTLTIAGLGVTDNGFGVFNYTLPVTGSIQCS